MKKYEVKKDLTNKEIGRLLLLVRKILKEAKSRGIEMSKRNARHYALEHLGWIGYENEGEIIESSSFLDGQRTANPRYKKSL